MKVPPELAHTLLVTVDEGSLDAAARTLHLTPSAVSQRLTALERSTGQVLLIRSRPVRATAAGEAVIRFARQVAHLERDVADELGLEGAPGAPLPLAVNADSLATWMLDPLARLATELGVTVDLRREDESYTAELLAQGAVVAAVTTRADPVPGCTVTPLGVMRYSAVATPAFAARWFSEGVDAASLATAPVVDFDRRDDLQSQWLALMGVDPASPPRHRIPSSTEFADAIALGMGWGLLPPQQRAGRRGELVELGGPDVEVALHWQQWRTHSPLLDAVAEAVADAARSALATGP